MIAVHAPDIARCVATREVTSQDWETTTMVAHSLRADGFDASEDGTGRGTPLVAFMPARTFGKDGGIDERFAERSVCDALHTSSGAGNKALLVAAIQDVRGTRKKKKNGIGIQENAETMYTLGARDQHAVSVDYRNGLIGEDLCGTIEAAQARGNRGQGVLAPLAFGSKGHGQDAGEVAPTLRGRARSADRANGGAPAAVAFAEDSRHEVRLQGGDGQCVGALSTGGGRHRSGTTGIVSRGVRRLTPRECERLMGLPDDWTLVEYNGRPAADGPRYEALGNSMAVPVLRWIGLRILAVEMEA